MTETRGPRSPNPVDIHVGARVRLRRKILKMSQEKLGERLGVTFQQVQKYERGANRVGASRLWKIAEVLDVPIGFFFEGLSDNFAQNDRSPELQAAEPDQSPIIYDFIKIGNVICNAQEVIH